MKTSSKEERIQFVKQVTGDENYWPIYASHGGGYIEPRKTKEGDIIYYHEGEIIETKRLPIWEDSPEKGTQLYIFWKTTTFVFQQNDVIVSDKISSSHIDGTEESQEKSESGDDGNFGANGFGRWNDNSTGMWDWD